MRRHEKREEIEHRDEPHDSHQHDEPHDERYGQYPDEHGEAAVEHRRSSWAGAGVVAQVNSLIALLLLAVEGLLGLRFLLVAFGANPDAAFVDFVLAVTGPLVAPFTNAFADRNWEQGVIEVNTALAMAVYFLAGVLLMLLVRAVTPRVREDRGETVRRRHVHES